MHPGSPLFLIDLMNAREQELRLLAARASRRQDSRLRPGRSLRSLISGR
jgi:hypothetical protein